MPFDNTICNRIAQDDQEAYASMYRHYFRHFFNYGKKFIADDHLIEDAVHETLLLVWEKRAAIPEIEFVSTYFFSAFRNTLFNRIKRVKPAELPSKTLEEPAFNAEQLIFQKETGEQIKKQLKRAIQSLTPRQREAIFLRFYEGLSFQEVATVLNITTKATYKIVARALSSLKEFMNYPTLLLIVILQGIINF